MDYPLVLDIEAVLKNEYIEKFDLLKEYFYNLEEDSDNDSDYEDDINELYDLIPENLKKYCDIWKSLKIWHNFHWFYLKKNVLILRLSKKTSIHEGLLEEDYNSFVRYIIIPLCSMILKQEIYEDDDHDKYKPIIFTDKI